MLMPLRKADSGPSSGSVTVRGETRDTADGFEDLEVLDVVDWFETLRLVDVLGLPGGLGADETRDGILRSSGRGKTMAQVSLRDAKRRQYLCYSQVDMSLSCCRVVVR